MYLTVLHMIRIRSTGSRTTASALYRIACQMLNARSASIALNIPHPGQRIPVNAKIGHGIPAPVVK